jgi:hypothetical protein
MKTAGESMERFLFIIILSSFVMITGPGGAAAYGQEALPGKIKAAVERSPLSDQGKAEILDAAGRALRAGIPADDVEIIISRGRDRGVGAGTTRELIDTAVKAREKGLPVRPVLNRIEQGLSKGVAPDRIAAASRNLTEKLSAAQPIVGELIGRGVGPGSDKDREYAIETVARALERSIPADAIARTGKQVGERRGSVVLFDKAVHTLTSLTESGMPVESASRLVRSAVDRGFTEKDLSKMERDVVEGLEKGKRMDDVVRSTESEISHEQKGKDRGSDRGRGGPRESGSERGRDKDTDRGDRGDHSDRGDRGGSGKSMPRGQ